MVDVLVPVYRDQTITGLFAWCEGCDSRHYVPVNASTLPDGQFQPKWDWNQKMDVPTFTPSILIYEVEGWQPRCHSFITDGVWSYLDDCTHALAGTTRPLKGIFDWTEANLGTTETVEDQVDQEQAELSGTADDQV